MALTEQHLSLCMNKKAESLKMGHFYKTQKEYNKLERFLNGKNFVIGYLTMVDFFLAEYAHYMNFLFPNEFKAFKGINRIQKTIEELPEVQGYYQRNVHILNPFLPPNYTWVPLFVPGT